MPTITFQPVLKDIKDILQSDFYSIPRFQRPYSWTSENLDDFWRDVVDLNDEGYFIGPMVSFKIKNEEYGIVDGQQRITSITLALCVLRDLFLELQSETLAKGLEKYLEREDDDSIAHFVLRSEAAGDYLKSQFQKRPPRLATQARNEEEKALKKAFDDIKSWMLDEIDQLDQTPGTDAKPSPAVVRLRDIRSRILALQVIWITLDSEDDAYIIFETLNSRGKDLEVVDLLKNFLLSAVRAENGDLDSARTNWSAMRETLEVAGSGANPNKFLLHWWLSRNEYVAERMLYKKIRQAFKKKDAPSMLIELRDDAELYAKISAPLKAKWSSQEREVKESLDAINSFGVRQPRPMLLAVMRAYRDGTIKLAKVKSTLRAIEAFHYITTAVVGKSSTGGVSMMYASHARELSKASTPNAVNLAIDKLVTKLAGALPGRDAFLAAFTDNMVYNESQRRLIQYTLRKLHDTVVTGVPTDHSKCNIEHISSQAEGEPWVHAIGNLLWVDGKLNTKLANQAFTKKRAMILPVQAYYDAAKVVQAKTWTKAEVADRTQELAERAYDRVWRVK